jgi:N-acetylglucosaminyldiphosphoundecaprenol N-acetyl-beta-D-mannosaminyltransferase
LTNLKADEFPVLKNISSKRGKTGLIFDLPISLNDKSSVISGINEVISQKVCGHYICITNTESMYHGLRDKCHRNYIKNADYSLCDGVGVIIAGRFWGLKIPRFTGPSLQLECSRVGTSRSWRHFFYGGKPGVATEMKKRLQNAYPGLDVCGVYEPPFRQLTVDEDTEIIKIINDAKPDIVWVGLGLLKQERWIAEHLNKIKAPWMIGVGAAFDYHAGAVPWAPRMLRDLGLEWLFRLIIQPRLRAKRYWWSLVYVVHAAAAGIFNLKWRKPQIIDADDAATRKGGSVRD